MRAAIGACAACAANFSASLDVVAPAAVAAAVGVSAVLQPACGAGH